MINPDRINHFKWYTMVAITIILVFHSYSFAQSEAGTVVMVTGKAFIVRGGEEIVAQPGLTVYENDSLRTEGTAKLKVYLKDDSVITLGENSRINLEEYLVATGEDRRSVVLNLITGKLRIIVGRIMRAMGSKYEVKTPTSITGVRGTHFYVSVIPGLSKVVLFSGELELRNILEDIKTMVVLTPGEMSIVPENQPPGEPVKLAEEELTKLILETEIYEEGGLIEEEPQLPVIEGGAEKTEDITDVVENLTEIKGLKDSLPPLEQEPLINLLSEVNVIIKIPGVIQNPQSILIQ
jgi:hypothetical protein